MSFITIKIGIFIICRNNYHFFNSIEDDNKNEEEDIVNNKISVNYIEEFINKDDNKLQKETQEIILDNNFSNIPCNDEISNNNDINNNLNNITNEKIYEIKNENLIKKNEINENIKKIMQNINKNKFKWEI